MGPGPDVPDVSDSRLDHLHDGRAQAAQVYDPQLRQDEARLWEDARLTRQGTAELSYTYIDNGSYSGPIFSGWKKECFTGIFSSKKNDMFGQIFLPAIFLVQHAMLTQTFRFVKGTTFSLS